MDVDIHSNTVDGQLCALLWILLGTQALRERCSFACKRGSSDVDNGKVICLQDLGEIVDDFSAFSFGFITRSEHHGDPVTE